MFKKLLNILFPIECIGCGRNDILLCENCFNSIKINKSDYFKNEYIDQIHVCTSFHSELLQKLIHFYKYNYIQKLSLSLSQLMIDYYDQIENKLESPIIIPVPLHKKKLLIRCFNQANLIAIKFSEKFDYSLKNDLIKRTKNTKQQAQLNKKGREENMRNAFQILDKNFIANKNFIIIDDIYTTGSTVSEIVRLLKEHQAKEIWCLVIGKN